MGDDEASAEKQGLWQLLPSSAQLDESARCWRGMLGEVHFISERHTDFSSYMFVRSGGQDAPFDARAFDVILTDSVDQLPGEVVRASQLTIIPDGAPAMLEGAFVADDLVHSSLMDGSATLWSDFRLNTDRFGWLSIVDT
nr:DUF3422 family protein [Sphingomonas sp. CCH18-H6]